MFNEDVYINFPWSHMSFNGIELSQVQVKSAYDIVMRAMAFKIKYEKLKIVNSEEDFEKFNLNNPRIYSTFRNDVIANISDRTATDYIMTCINKIRNSDFNKKSVRDSFDILNKYLTTEEFKSKFLKQALAEQKSFINFPAIIDYCHTTTITENHDIIRRIKVIQEKYRKKYADYIK